MWTLKTNSGHIFTSVSIDKLKIILSSIRRLNDNGFIWRTDD